VKTMSPRRPSLLLRSQRSAADFPRRATGFRTFAARAGDTRADRLHAFEDVSMFFRPGRGMRSSVDMDMTGQGDQDTLKNFTNKPDLGAPVHVLQDSRAFPPPLPVWGSNLAYEVGSKF
jgi:hypothetical protein